MQGVQHTHKKDEEGNDRECKNRNRWSTRSNGGYFEGLIDQDCGKWKQSPF